MLKDSAHLWKKIGPEFRINTITFSDQENPIVAATDDGGFVIVWDSLRQTPDGRQGGIFAKIYNAEGVSSTDFGILVNVTTDSDQRYPFVVSEGKGFTTIWSSKETTRNVYDLYGRTLPLSITLEDLFPPLDDDFET